MFSASRKEWVELVALMKVMSKDKVHWSNGHGLPIKGRTARLECIQRKEQNGFRTYRRMVKPGDGTEEHPDATVIEIFNADTQETLTVEAELWADAADHAVEILRNDADDATVPVDDAMEAFLDDIQMMSIGGITEGPWHILLGINGQKTAVTGVLSRCGAVPTRLLDGGRAANLKLLQTGTRFAQPMAQKVNYLDENLDDVVQVIRDRMDLIERMGSSLKYDDVADKVFRCNLAMLDLHMGRLVTELVRISYLEDIVRLSELIPRINEQNPLKVKQELIDKHHYYEFKIRQLLLACIGGMRPAKIYTGSNNFPAFFLVVTPDGTPVLLDASNRDGLGNFLLQNARLERGSMAKDHYGVLERENNAYYFKFNLKIGMTKR